MSKNISRVNTAYKRQQSKTYHESEVQEILLERSITVRENIELKAQLEKAKTDKKEKEIHHQS